MLVGISTGSSMHEFDWSLFFGSCVVMNLSIASLLDGVVLYT